MYRPAGEGVAVVDSPGHTGQVGWQRWLLPSVEYRENTDILIHNTVHGTGKHIHRDPTHPHKSQRMAGAVPS